MRTILAIIFGIIFILTGIEGNFGSVLASIVSPSSLKDK